MENVLITGVGGQGTVLAAKVLAMAGASKGWHVRTSETIGMAQRGGSVTSHVRLANLGEEVLAPVITHGTADLIIAFEPGEAARVMSYLAPSGAIVTATTTVEPVSAALSSTPYKAKEVISNMQTALYNKYAKDLVHSSNEPTVNSGNNGNTNKEGRQRTRSRVIPVDDMYFTNKLGRNRKVLNSILLAASVSNGVLPITIDDLKNAVAACVKPQFVEMNIRAIDLVSKELD